MNSLADRITRVIALGRVESARSWALKAGLSGGALGAFLTRSRKAPDGERPPTLEAATVIALARAADVDPAWLLEGRGTMDASAPTEARYPNLEIAVQHDAADGKPWRPDTIAAVRARQLKSSGDLTPSQWRRILRLTEDRLLDVDAEELDLEAPNPPQNFGTQISMAGAVVVQPPAAPLFTPPLHPEP